MLKKVTIFLSYLATALAACALTLYFCKPQTGKLNQLEALITERFIGTSDTVAMEDAAAEAMIASLGDRWSYYVPAAQYAQHLEQTQNAYVGIGITITVKENEDGLHILSVDPNGSAYASGIQPEDIIIAIDGNDTRNMSSQDAKALVRGEAGTLVELTILRGDEQLSFSVPRKKIETVVAKGEMLDGNIGLITIANFDSRCASETTAAIEALLSQGANALIFDVRNNPGGYASELVSLLDYLLPEGDLFKTVDYTGKEHVDTSDSRCLTLPMAVLCNEDSYSAAEFFAAAMQEYGAAIIVGQPTCGKGYFQCTYTLSDGSAAAISVGKYFTPNGNSLIDTGIQPDIPVAVSEEEAAQIYYGTMEPNNDPQLQAAIQALLPESNG